MKSTSIKVLEVSHEEMINHESRNYNSEIWDLRVEFMIKSRAKFYEAKPDNVFEYSRFYTQYKIKEGLIFLKRFSPYSSMLTSNGFVRAFIVEGEIFTHGWGEHGENCVENSTEGRKYLADNICKYGTMITNGL